MTQIINKLLSYNTNKDIINEYFIINNNLFGESNPLLSLEVYDFLTNDMMALGKADENNKQKRRIRFEVKKIKLSGGVYMNKNRKIVFTTRR